MATLTKILGEKLLICSKSSEIETDELKEKFIGLYFSAQWCNRCRDLTPRLIQAYDGAFKKNKNLPFEIVLIPADADQESFDEYSQTMPWKAIPFQDRDRADDLHNRYRIQDIPSLIILKPDCELLTDNAEEEFESIDTIEKWANGQTMVWTRASSNSEDDVWLHISCNACHMKPLIGSRFGCPDRECGYDLCQECFVKDGTHHQELIEFWSPKKNYSIERMFPTSALIAPNGERPGTRSLESQYIGLYFSARWSRFSSSLTSGLAAVYQKAIEINLPFDIIYISGDDNQRTFDKEYEEMPWKALPFDHRTTIQLQLKNYFSVYKLPTFIVLKPTGEKLTTWGRKNIENISIEAIQAWCKGENVGSKLETYVWSSISCDGCDMTPLVGERFHCEMCFDYDLCSTCAEKGHEHKIVLISQPNDDEED